MSLSNLWIHFQRVRREIAVGVRGCRYLCSEIKRIFQTTNTMYVTKSVTIGFSHLPFAFTLRRAAKSLLKLCTIEQLRNTSRLNSINSHKVEEEQ